MPTEAPVGRGAALDREGTEGSIGCAGCIRQIDRIERETGAWRAGP